MTILRRSGRECHNLFSAILIISFRKSSPVCDPVNFDFNLIQKDPDDNKFVDCAITAGARYIVTEDHHYDVIKWKEFPGLDVVGLDEFLKHLLKINL